MSLLSPPVLGLALLLLGIGLFGITLIALRVAPQTQPGLPEPHSQPPASPSISGHSEGVLLIQRGGRVAYINQKAREWFNISDAHPNLERLGRRARPSDVFWGLCVSEGQARLNLDGRSLEATSFFVPYNGEQAMLIALHRSQLVVDAASSQPGESSLTISHQAFSVFAELSQKMAANLNLEATLIAILEGIERLIPADFPEIGVWDPTSRRLTPYHLVGIPEVDRQLEKSAPRSTASGGYSGYLITKRTPLLVTDIAAFQEASPAVEHRQYPFTSYLGLPLILAGELVGTIELASVEQDAFTSADLEALRLLSGQAAVALHNALLFEEQQRRALELAGLAKLSQSVSSLNDPLDLYARLIESISPLLEVEVLGFLIYNANQKVLEARYPFLGVEPNILGWSSFPIPPGSLAETSWITQQAIIAAQAQADPHLQAFGLDNLARAAGVQQAVLAPLTTGGRMLGYLLAGDKRDGSSFDQPDLRLLSIITSQSAAIIDNAALIQQARHRAQRAETLRRITSLTGSSATLDEILMYSVQDLSRLLQADKAAIYLLDETRGELVLHKPSLFGVSPEIAAQFGHLPADDPQFQTSVTGSQRPFISDEVVEDKRIIPLYQPLVANLGIRSALVAPLVVRGHGIGEIMVGNQSPHFFNQGDLQTLITAAGQLASAIEQATLITQTDESLRRRINELVSLTRISRELNSTLDLKYLLQRVYEEALRSTSADCGTIILFQLTTPTNRPEAAGIVAPPSPKIMLHLGDASPGELLPYEHHVLTLGESLIVDDFNHLPDLITETDSAEAAKILPAHPEICSALIVPIAYQERVAGLIHLHSRLPHHFDSTAREIAEALAVQAAIALGNAHRYQELTQRNELLSRRVETLAKLLETSGTSQLEKPLEQALEDIAYAIQASTPFDVVLISVYNQRTSELNRVAAAGIPTDRLAELRQRPQPWSSVQELLDPEYNIGRAYFIPYEKMPVMPPGLHTLTLLPEFDDDAQPADHTNRWHPEDVLIVPLFGGSGQPLGLISVDAPRDNLRPDRPAVDSLEVFASQAGLVIMSHRTLAETKDQVVALQEQIKRIQDAEQDAQQNLPVLMQKGIPQTVAVNRLSQRYQRVQAVMETAQIISSQADRQSALAALGREIVMSMGLDVALLVEADGNGMRLVQVLGTIAPETNLEALLGQRNPLHLCMQSREEILAPGLDTGTEWSTSPLLQALQAKSFICLPIVLENHLEAALLAVSRAQLAPISEEDRPLFTMLARQTAITLQNLSLLKETSRRLDEVDRLLEFSRQIGSLEPAHILQTLADSALHVAPAGQACMIAIWDSKKGTLFPQVARGYHDNQTILEITYRSGEALPGQAFADRQSKRIDEVDFARHYDLPPDNLLRFRNAMSGLLPVSALVVPIIRSTESEPLGVVVLENYKEAAAFTSESQALVESLAQQTALSLDNSRLYQAAEQRASQLQAFTGIAAIISSNLQPEELIQSLLDRLQEILPYNTGTLWLRQGEKMIVRAARGFTDSDERIGINVAITDSELLQGMITTHQPISVRDVRSDPRFSTLIEAQHLSWLGLPLITSGEIFGVIALEKSEPDYYTAEHVQIGKTFASQAAVALENATLYQSSLGRAVELDQRSQRVEQLNRFSRELSGSLDFEHLLNFTLKELYQDIPCSTVSAVLFEPSGGASIQSEHPASLAALPILLPETPLFKRLQQSLGIFNTANINQPDELGLLAEFLDKRGARSLLAIPLATGGAMTGAFLLQGDRPERFSSEEVGLARTICSQAAIAIQNARLYAETVRLTEELDQRVRERTDELVREHHRTETLLRIITELSASLDLEQVLSRTLKVLNQMVEAEQITVLIARPGEKNLRHLASIGREWLSPLEKRYTRLEADQGFAGWIIQQHMAAMVPDLQSDPRWIDLPESPISFRSAIGVPLTVGAETLGAMLFYHTEVGHFSTDQLDLIQAAANQIAVAVNNAELYRLIRDQAEDLGNMVRSQQIETQRTIAILEDVADGVLVTDAHRSITLFNGSAERILGLDRARVIGKSLEYFTGLFGSAAQSWMETIQTWSQDPSVYKPGDTYEEQITLDDGRVVSIHLAPVSLRDTFLGTVSIFRDITHQVEVDRLKSEFVATVSHELRTPMTSIKGYVEILLMGAAGALSEQQTHFLEIVKGNTERLAILVNDLLDISRIESGRIGLTMQPVNLADLAQDAINELRRRSQEDHKPMKIEIELPADLPRIHGDMERVRQILDNLLENAYYYTQPNGHIQLSIRRAGSDLQIDVQDNGIGILPEQQARVFERFYRGEHPFVLATSGTGLGLSVVQHLVERHAGRIWLTSTGVPGQGSTFSFTLPIYEPES